ncbi:MAG: chitobiase/beta-hexosaminidase C-terminal domain-containing protein, partial [Chloroflexota bacterium]
SQEGCVPVSYHKPTYDAIKVAIAQGITVIEAAGNGNNDLDENQYNPGHDPFSLNQDSGAIMVGASDSSYRATKQERASFSNYGDTVDLYAWGGDTIAPAYGNYYDDDGDYLAYTLFGGTSGASPIVASAVAILQSSYFAKNGEYATPAEVKQILQSTGTPQLNENGENIGVMPDLRAAINQIWNISEVTAPTITPSSGVYQMPLQVTIGYGDNSQNSSNTHIRYTLDGTEPTENSFIYIPEQGDTLYLNYQVTVRAKAFSNFGGSGYVDESETTTAILLSGTPKVSTPVIIPSGGTYNVGTQLILSTDTPGATIRYRLDGRTPSFFYPGTKYTGPVNLPVGTHEVTARGYKDGYYKSDVAYSDPIVINNIQLPMPTIYPNSGTFNGEVNVYMGSTVLGADIHYTVDGSTPTESSPKFVEPFALTEDTTVKARVYLDSYTPSDVTTVEYEIISEVSPPVINPADGTTATDTLQVSMSVDTQGATIRYTTNGAEPTAYSEVYDGPFTLGHGEHTVKAKAFLSGAANSSTTTANYTVYDPNNQIDPPVIYPPVGNYNGPISVTITSETEGVFISYTTDGSDPFSSATVKPYIGPFVLEGADNDYLIRARAFKASANPSSVASIGTHRLTVVTPTLGQVITPTIDPPTGTYTNTFTAKVTAPDFLAPFRIRGLHITQDGTMPLANRDNQQSGSAPVNVSVSESKTVKAVGSQVGWEDSEVATAEYTLQCDTPLIMTGGTYTETAEVSMSSGTTSAKIYYTTDGSEPTDQSSLYDQPFSLSVGEHVVRAMCTRNNFEPSETTTAAFLVNPTPVAPNITQQPTNQNGEVCGSAQFEVMATGTPDPVYQWMKDGNILAGEDEPTLELAILRMEDAGSYTVVVSNSAGEVTSSNAVLSIADNGAICFDQKQTQTITFDALPITATVGVTLSLSASATSDLPVTYESSTLDVCTVSGDEVMTISEGTCSVNALQTGNGDFAPAPIVSQSFEVMASTKMTQLISFPEPPNTDELEVGNTFELAASADSGLSITYQSETPAVCSVSSTTVTILSEGTCTINASQIGNGEFEAAQSVRQSFVVGSEPPVGSDSDIFLPMIRR